LIRHMKSPQKIADRQGGLGGVPPTFPIFIVWGERS
jgi:hypothetical protein